MKLIDRNLLLQTIEESREKNPHENSKIRANHTIEHDHIAHLVLEQPTAYDVDKVVKMMEEKVVYETGEDGCVIEEYVRLEEAIEIVKSGGIE